MCLNGTCRGVRVDHYLFGMFCIKIASKQGDTLSILLSIFALDYAIRRVQVNRYGLKLNGTLQLLVYIDDGNISGGSVHTIKKNLPFVVASKATGVEVNADKTKYMVMSRDQKAE